MRRSQTNVKINQCCQINKLVILITPFPGLFVVVSWVSFLVPPEVVPGRMAMLITLFLVLINIFNTVTTNSPNAEGMNAITAWMLVCILFVFGALIAYAFLLWRKKNSVWKKHKVVPLLIKCPLGT